jgi:hypothetical protein
MIAPPVDWGNESTGSFRDDFKTRENGFVQTAFISIFGASMARPAIETVGKEPLAGLSSWNGWVCPPAGAAWSGTVPAWPP